jgi:hypothetical protein
LWQSRKSYKVTSKYYNITVSFLQLKMKIIYALILLNQINATISNYPRICSLDKTISCSQNTDCTGGVCYVPTAGGDTLTHQVCMQTAAGQTLQCTANDVNLAATTSLHVAHSCAYPGDTATVSFVAKFDLTS